MNDNVEPLNLAHFRTIPDEMSAMRSDIPGIEADVSNVDHKNNGLTVNTTMIAANVHHIEGRVEAHGTKG